MSVQEVLARIAQIDQALVPKAPAAATGTPFQAVLGAQTDAVAPTTLGALSTGATGFTPAIAAGGSGTGPAAMVQAAAAEVGQTEQPPGSNDSPRIAEYRQATAGSGVGPWCAYFVSWAARSAGAPIGEQGQGFGSVEQVWDWAQRSGKAIPAGTGTGPSGASGDSLTAQPPQTGDLIVWGGRHIGMVESVDPDGTIHTIEGNSSDRVSQRTYGPDGGGATGFVRLG
jgi:CHAP domain